MQVDVERAAEPAADPHHGEDEELLRVVGELHAEAGPEDGHDGVLALLEPDGEQAEHDGAADGREEAAPVVADGEVDRGDLDTEQHA